MTAAPDYESYSVKHPHLHAADAYPKELLPLLEGRTGTFLDVGAGFGSALRALAQGGHLARFSTVIACDIAQVHVDSMKHEMPEIEAIRADALALPIPSESIDVYFSDQVIEHVPSDREMAREAYRVLKPGGVAFVGSVLKAKYAWYFYRANGKWAIDPTHVREYTSVEEYRRVFAEAGFECLAIDHKTVTFPLHRMVLVVLVACKLLTAQRALRLSTYPAIQAIGRIRMPIPGYSFINAFLAKRTHEAEGAPASGS
jgi:ubiquinone/menaquinone biosynthesis C-methylase UbiE